MQQRAAFNEIAALGLFAPVVHSCHPWRWRLDTARYIALARSHASHQMLPPDRREALFADLAAAITAEGGEIELQYEGHLYKARRNA